MGSPPSLWGLKEAENPCGVESFCRALLILSLTDAHVELHLEKVCSVFASDKCEEDAQTGDEDDGVCLLCLV